MTTPDRQSVSGQRQLLYFADPMCSWCWGFSPVIKAIAQAHGDRLQIRPMMGGLRPGTDKPMDQKSKDEIRAHWEHVQSGTGQEFNFTFFEREGFVYDTEPSCRAVVTARGYGVSMGLAVLARLHKAFYMENQDITDADTIISLAVEEGCDKDTFKETYTSDMAKQETEADFHIAQRFGVTGFPTLLAGNEDDGFALVTIGYQPLEALAEPIAEWLEADLADET